MAADKVIDLTDLKYYHDQVAGGAFAAQGDLDALSGRVDDIVAEGGEPNVIEQVKVNGSALTPDSGKAVNVEALQGASLTGDIRAGAFTAAAIAEATERGHYTAELQFCVPTSTSHLVNDGDGTEGSAFATQAYVAQNGGRIDKIKVNGVEQAIAAADKSVDIRAGQLTGESYNGTNKVSVQQGEESSITMSKSDDVDAIALAAAAFDHEDAAITIVETIPTTAYVDSNISNALANGTNPYQTASDVQSAIDTAVSSAYKYKGSVATVDALPASGQATGDVYDVQASGMNYAWNGAAWDALGQYVDTSLFWTTEAYTIATTADIDAIFAAE